MEVRLLDHALVDGNSLLQRVAHAEDRRALDLRHHVVRTDDDAGVDRGPDVVHVDPSGLSIHGDLGNRGGVRPRVGERDAERAARALAIPVGHPRRFFHHTAGPRVVGEQTQAEGDRVDPLGGGHLVDERLDGELVVAGADRPPRPDVDAAVLAQVFVELVVARVGDLVALDQDLVLALEPLVHGRQQPGQRRGADDAMAPRGEIAVGVEAGLEVLGRQRPVLVVLDVVLAAPDDLHRLAGRLGEQHRVEHEILLDLAAEAAPEEHHVDLHLVGRGLEDAGGGELIDAR